MKTNKLQKQIGLTIFFFVLISIVGAQTYLEDDILNYARNESTLKTSEGETITVTNPNSNTVWEAGTTQYIRWIYTGIIDYVDIYLRNGEQGVYDRRIGENIPNHPSGECWFEWTIPNDLFYSTNYQIIMGSWTLDGHYIDDKSEYFTIIEEHKSITVTNPIQGESWVAGNTQEPYYVRWESTGYALENPQIDIILIKGGSHVFSFTAKISSSYAFCWLPNDLLYGEDYYFRIEENTNNIFGESPFFTITEDPTPPSKPTLLSPDNGDFVTTRQPVVEWNPVPRAVMYQIQFCKSPDFSYQSGWAMLYTTDTQILASPSLIDRTVYWRVQAKNSLGYYSEWSDTWSYIIDTIHPDPPTLLGPLEASKVNTNTPTLSWTEETDVFLYRVFISDSPTLDTITQYEIITVPYLTTTELADKTYYWRVRAEDQTGLGSASIIGSFTVDTTPPVAPTLLSPSIDSVINDDTVIFQWTDIDDAIEYGIQVYMSTDFSFPIIDMTLTDIQYSVSGLYDGDYYWRVIAKDDVGNWCSWSSFNKFTVDAILSIYIDDYETGVDWSWAVNQWWCTGSGKETDPYVIKDITINAKNSGSGIEIRNSNVFFVIENCFIHSSGSEENDSGIYLYNTDNGILIKNNCSLNNNYGIHLDQSNDNTILENIVSDNLNGIRLYMSSYNTILKNTIENNRFHTCYLFGGSNNNVSNNYAFDNTYGFGMYQSSFNTFTNNLAMEIGYECYFLTDSSYNMFLNNTASGKDFVSDGFRIHMNSNNNNFTGNKALNNALRGFFLSDNAYDNIFSENIVNGEGITNAGFWLNKVSNNLIFQNDITGTSIGIMIWDYSDIGGFDNIIWGNNFTGNELHAQDDGINNLWDNGTLGNYWDDYPGIDYNDDGIGDSPYYISGSAVSQDNYPIWDDGENTPIGEDIEFDDPVSGTYIKFSDITEGGTTSVVVSDTGIDPPSGFSVSGQYYDITTTASYSGVITIAIPYSGGNPRLMHWDSENGQWEDITTVIDTTNNIIYGNVSSLSEFVVMTGMSPTRYIDSDFTFTEDIYGPIIITADNIVIDGNGFKLKGGGTGIGFYLNGRTGVTIKNVAIERWTYGFYLSFSDFNILTENTVANGLYGFYLYSSSNNLLLNNIANQNKYIGFYLRFNSEFNVLTYNTATENYEAGFHLLESSDNNFLSDNIAINNGHGFYLRDSNYNAFLNNIADGSTYSGFSLTNSSYNIFLGNNGSNANYGFSLGDNSNSNILAANTIKFNWGGIFIRINPYTSETGSDNLIFRNNFIDNVNQARDGNAGNNYWYNPDTDEGNYWSDYTGEDADGDGIGETPKYVWGGVVGLYTYDQYPFIYEKSWISIDSDNDGILDVYEEVIYGTDPLDSDTDDDGLWDGEEIFNRRSDPLNYMDPVNLSVIIDNYVGNGVGDFTWAEAAQQPWCIGSGTFSDPYIIANLIIDGQNVGSCITIRDSDIYFIIQNCMVTNSGSGTYDAGIRLVNTNNGKIFGNDISYNKRAGIEFHENCFNNTIVGNILTHNSFYAIWLRYSDNNSITANEIFDNSDDGIHFYYSDDNTVNFNLVMDSYDGIRIHCSHNSVVFNNTFYSNSIGLSIRWGHESNIFSNNISGNSYGILIDETRLCNIYDNTIENSVNDGIWIRAAASDKNIIFSNDIYSNGRYGVYLQDSICNNNKIYHNNFTANNINAFDNGIDNYWDNGTLGNYWDNYPGVDLNDDGIGDTPYLIGGSTGTQDNYPIWNDGPLSPPITYSTTLPCDIYIGDWGGIIIGGDGITIDGNGFKIIGNNIVTGITLIGVENVIIKNLIIIDCEVGILVQDSQGIIIDNCTFSNGILVDCLILNSNIQDSVIQNSDISYSSIFDCELFDDRIVEGQVTNTVIHDGEIVESSIFGGLILGGTVWNSHLENLEMEAVAISSDGCVDEDACEAALVKATGMHCDVVDILWIENSVFIDSIISNSNIFATVFSDYCIIDTSTLKDCQVEGCSIEDSEIVDSILRFVTSNNNSISYSSIHDCELFDDRIVEGQVTNTVIHDGEIVESSIFGGLILGGTVWNSHLENLEMEAVAISSDGCVDEDACEAALVKATGMHCDVVDILWIENSVFIDSIISNSNIFATVFSDYCIIDTSTLKDCQVEGCSIEDSEIVDSILRFVTSNNNSISYSSIHDCELFEDRIVEGQVTNTVIHDSNIQESSVFGGFISGGTVWNSYLENLEMEAVEIGADGTLDMEGVVYALAKNTHFNGVKVYDSIFIASSITGSVLQGTDILGNSNVDLSTLVDCLVESGTIQNSDISYTSIYDSMLTDNTIEGSQVKYGDIHGGIIRDTVITESTLEGTEIRNGQLDLNTLVNCLVSEGFSKQSIMTGCGIDSLTSNGDSISYSSIFDCELFEPTIVGSQITYGEVHGGYIVDSTVDNIIAYNSIISATKIQDSELQGNSLSVCDLVSSLCVEGYTTLSDIIDCVINGGSVESSDISYSSIYDSMLTDNTIEGSTITSSEVDNTYIVDSSIDFTIIQDSEVDGGTVQSSDVFTTVISNSVITGFSFLSRAIMSMETINSQAQYTQIQDCIINFCNISNSIIDNSTIQKCLMNSTIIRFSEVHGGIIGGCDLDDNLIQDAFIQSTDIQDTTIQNCTIDSSVIKESFVRDTIIQSSTIIDSDVQDSTIYDSLIIDSGIYNEDIPISDFDTIFSKYKDGGFKLVSTNPGQFFYNIEIMNERLVTIDSLSVNVIIPADFILEGSNPIHIYLNGNDITETCTIEGTLVSVSNIAPGSVVKVEVHLDYKLKGCIYENLEDFGMKSYIFNVIVSESPFDTFSSSASLVTHQKKTTALAGFLTDINGNPIVGAIINLTDLNGNLINTTVSDESGFYYFLDLEVMEYIITVTYISQTFIQTIMVVLNELTQVDFIEFILF